LLKQFWNIQFGIVFEYLEGIIYYSEINNLLWLFYCCILHFIMMFIVIV